MKNRNFYTILVHGAIISIGGKFLGALFQFIAQTFLGRNLGPENFGRFSIGWGFFQIAGVVATFGLDYAIIKFGTEYYRKDRRSLKRVLLSFNYLSVLISGFIIIVILLLARFTLKIFGKEELLSVIRLFTIGVPFFALLRVNGAATRITQNMSYSVLTEEVARRAIQLLFFLIFLQFSFSLHESILSTILSFVISSLIIIGLSIRLFWNGASFDIGPKINYLNVIKYSIFVTGSSITSSVLIWFDRVLLGLLQPAVETGLYQAASQIGFIFSSILLASSIPLAPLIAAKYQRGEIDELGKIFKVSTKYILFLGLPLAIIIFMNPSLVLGGVFGISYLGAKNALIIIAITQLFNIGTGVVAQILLLSGFEKKWFLFTFLAFLLNIILNIILIPKFGSLGAALGSGISLTALNFFGLFSSKKIIGVFPYDKQLIKSLIAVLITMSVLILIDVSNVMIKSLNLLIYILISYLSFYLTIFALGIDDKDRIVIRELRDLLYKIFKKEKYET